MFPLFLISLFLLCCTPSLMPPIETDVDIARRQWKNSSLSQLNEGYTLYINKCGHCHYLHRPDQYPDEKWNKMLPIMGKRAKLDSLQLDLITKYIFTAKETKSFSRKK
ncbi:MAG: hypothetical protein HY840_10000 [Bacteroidetes bacterium]|nr:hypothetical protein [Bacteroidota bacterium]